MSQSKTGVPYGVYAKKEGAISPEKGAITFLPLISIVILPLEFQLCDLTPIFFPNQPKFYPVMG
jgi:hypothetical protein